MTDGANTRSPTYPGHDGGDAALANALTSETCTNMKAKPNVTIYTIAFEVTDPTAHYHVPLLLSPYGYTTYRGS